MATRSNVFIVDDHQVIREVLTEFIALEEDLDVCGTAASAAEALEMIPKEGCDIALIDISMPGMSGIELVHRLRVERPGLRCLILSGHAEQVYVRDAMAAGAAGYVMKGDPDAIVKALRCVLGGEVYLSDEVRRHA